MVPPVASAPGWPTRLVGDPMLWLLYEPQAREAHPAEANQGRRRHQQLHQLVVAEVSADLDDLRVGVTLASALLDDGRNVRSRGYQDTGRTPES